MFVIGIAGGTCSGKSTLTENLAGRLADIKLTVINMDAFFRPVSLTTVAPITRKTYVEHNIPDSLRLDELRAAFAEAVASDADAVIIEGLFALHLDDIRERLDYKIFVDLESDERIIRRVRRFTAGGRQTFDEVVDRYLDTVRYRHTEIVEPSRWHADTVVNGNADFSGTAGDVIETYIRHKINK